MNFPAHGVPYRPYGGSAPRFRAAENEGAQAGLRGREGERARWSVCAGARRWSVCARARARARGAGAGRDRRDGRGWEVTIDILLGCLNRDFESGGCAAKWMAAHCAACGAQFVGARRSFCFAALLLLATTPVRSPMIPLRVAAARRVAAAPLVVAVPVKAAAARRGAARVPRAAQVRRVVGRAEQQRARLVLRTAQAKRALVTAGQEVRVD
jgi:hypothetical protein